MDPEGVFDQQGHVDQAEQIDQPAGNQGLVGSMWRLGCCRISVAMCLDRIVKHFFGHVFLLGEDLSGYFIKEFE